jgi:hypothetical protein
MFAVDIRGLSAAQRVISASGIQSLAGPQIEKAVVLMAKEFREKVRQEAPLGRGRLSQWQRRSHRGHGDLRKHISLSTKRGGFNTVSRVKAPPIANIVGSGAKLHDIKPLHGLYLKIGNAFIFGAIEHPGFQADHFWQRATLSLEGQIEPIMARTALATADVMAANIAAGVR